MKIKFSKQQTANKININYILKLSFVIKFSLKIVIKICNSLWFLFGTNFFFNLKTLKYSCLKLS